MNEIGYHQDHFFINAGKSINRTIGSWVGWKRQLTGIYTAPAWVSSLLEVDLQVPGLPLQWSLDAAMVRDRLLAEMQAAKRALESEQVLRHPTTTQRQPRVYQSQAVNAMRHMGWRCLLADDMGLGKTSTSLWGVADSGAKRLLVVCPVSVKFNWCFEIEETIGEQWHTRVIDGTPKQRANIIAQIGHLVNADDEPSVAAIINYDLLRTLSDEQFAEMCAFASGSFLICDEGHYLKSREAQRSRLSKQISNGATQVVLVGGTPVRDTPEDLWHQIEMVRPGTFRSFNDFEKRHLQHRVIELPGRRGRMRQQRIVVGTKNVDALNAVMNTLQVRRLKADVGDIPPKVHTYPDLELDGITKRVYKAMKDFARVELKELLSAHGPINVFDPRAQTAVEASMRCEQIAQGFLGGIPEPVLERIGDTLKHAVKIEGRPRELVFPTAPKLRWILETIETVRKQGGAPLVFSRFNAPMFWLEQHLRSIKLRTIFMHGGLTAAEKNHCVQEFKEKRLDVLLCQVKIAEGWNAQRSQDVLFLGRDWSPAINAQAEDRAHRLGQKGTVNVQIPIVRGTVEVMHHRKLVSKDADAQQALANTSIAELLENL